MSDIVKGIGIVTGSAITIFALLWVLTFVGIFGPGNVKDQWRFAYDYDEDLRAIARQVCDAQALADSSVGSAKVQRESQTQAIRLNYQRVRGDYDARLRDAFRAGIVHPADVPDRAPSLEAMQAQEC